MSDVVILFGLCEKYMKKFRKDDLHCVHVGCSINSGMSSGLSTSLKECINFDSDELPGMEFLINFCTALVDDRYNVKSQGNISMLGLCTNNVETQFFANDFMN